MLPKPQSSLERRIARLYAKDGLSSRAIADRLDLHRSKVAKIVKRLGISRTKGWRLEPQPHLEARNAEIERLYRRGLTVNEIIAHMELTITRMPVEHALRRRGVKLRQRGAWASPRPAAFYRTREYAEEIAPLLGTGPHTTAAAFARARGIKVETLRRHLRAIGAKSAPKGLGTAVLTIAEVAEIKRALSTTRTPLTVIAEKYGVSPSVISSIAKGKSWTIVPWPEGKTYIQRPPPGWKNLGRDRGKKAKR